MNHLSAGLLAGIPLALVFIVYMGVRGKNLVIFFKGLDGTGADIPDRGWFVVILIAFLAASFLFGIVAGLVYGWLGEPSFFTGLAISAAFVLSVLAVASKTPLILDKIVWNFAAGGFLGILIPLFSGIVFL